MSIYMVERELTGNSMIALSGFHGSIAAGGETAGTRYLRSLFLPITGRFFCLFESPSAEAVRKVNDEAGLPYKAIMPASELPYPI